MKLKTNNRIHCVDKKLTKHKYLEIQWGRFYPPCCFFDFQFEWTRKQDHAGFNWHIEIFGWHLIIKIYDCRHWSRKFDNWEE